MCNMFSKFQYDSLELLPENIKFCVILTENLFASDELTSVIKTQLGLLKRLYEKNSSIQVIVSGKGNTLVGNAPKVVSDYICNHLKIPVNRIILDKEGKSLLESMQNVAKIVEKEPFVFFTDYIRIKRYRYICRRLKLNGYGVTFSDLGVRREKFYRLEEFILRFCERCKLTPGMKGIYKIINKIRFLSALYLGKILFHKLKKAENDPTSEPGRIATLLCPDILKYLTKHIRIIFVTGTNGKTSTMRMIEQQLKEKGVSCFSNRSGANIYMGVTAEFLIHSNLRGRYKESYAVIECDEGNLPKISPLIQSDDITVVVTNLFQDQLDRFGKLEYTRKCILSAIADLPKARVILNADCSMTASLAEEITNECIFFGIDGKEEADTMLVKNTMLCPFCATPLLYRKKIYGHFGDYYCPKCKWERPKRDMLLSDERNCYRIRFGKDNTVTLPVTQSVPYYSLYNNLAVAAVLWKEGIEGAVKDCFLKKYHNPGRFEKITIDGCDFYILLCKNPVSFQQSLKWLPENLEGTKLIFGLNTNIGDGLDASWVWECDFSFLLKRLGKDTEIYSFGQKCIHMALKLKYDGLDANEILCKETFANLYETVKKPGSSVYIFANYTAMFSTRIFLQEKAHLKKVWEEEV